MSIFLTLILLVLGFALVGGLFGTLRGPLAADRMISAQLLGTVGVAFSLILAEVTAAPALRDVGLVIAALSGVITLAFVRLHGGDDRK